MVIKLLGYLDALLEERLCDCNLKAATYSTAFVHQKGVISH